LPQDFLSKSKIINLIYQEFKRLKMNNPTRRKYLRTNYRRQSLQEFNEQELVRLLEKLRKFDRASLL
ncbi:MAG: hypothetical protein ACKO4S_02745, partial [Snowella sp.]